MHQLEMHILFFLLLFLLPHEAFSTAAAAGGCNRRCVGAIVPYPFGFSSGCHIQLSCNAANSTSFLKNTTGAMVPILSFNSTASTFRVPLQPSCSRKVSDAKKWLSGANYAVSSHTTLFVTDSCGAANSSCSVPAGILSRMLPTPTVQCVKTTVTCIASTPSNAGATTPAIGVDLLLQLNKVRNASCCDVLTAAVYGDTKEATASLHFGVAELGWWLNGTCTGGGSKQCVENATCHDVQTPSGASGHRCACEAGMDGDGFAAGDGCHRAAGSKKNKKNVPFIVVGVLAGVAAAAGVLLLCWVQCQRYAAGRSGSDRIAAMRLLSEAASSSGVPVYSYHEVARATNSFSHTHRLGTGAYGTVYVGKILASSPSLVAIKRLRYRHDDDDDDTAVALLLNEIKLISSLSHPNLVRLLGCCLDRGEQILVYEFMPNGTLSHHLLGGGGGLSWRARLGVAAETAGAIAYLHAMRPPIFHRDVKSSNILLDGDLRPKLADFGLSRAVRLEASHVSTAPQGTPGYVDPEYHQNFHLSDKSDVYSFGVVLLELITAMKVVDFGRPATEVNLASLALDRIGKGRVNEIVDPALVDHGEEWVMDSIRHVSELAFRCLAFQKDVRPCMSEVAAELRLIRDAASASGPELMSRLGPMMGLEIDVGFDGPVTAAKKAVSPVSVQETWVTDQSSPSTSGSMPRFTSPSYTCKQRGSEM